MPFAAPWMDLEIITLSKVSQTKINSTYYSYAESKMTQINMHSEQKGFPGGSVLKNLPAGAGDSSSIPRSARSPGEGNGNTLQYSCLGNPLERGAGQAAVHGVAQSQTQLEATQHSPWYRNRLSE